jgi:adenylyltransferase/sulfurtransferase
MPSGGKEERYSRQTLVKAFGRSGQRKLGDARVVIIGCGATGGIMANNLVRAGVGSITVIDSDRVELCNLHRQVLYDETDVGQLKARTAGLRLYELNSDVKVHAIGKKVNRNNITEIIRGADLVCDGVDNMETRYIINDACVKLGINWIYAGVLATFGMTMPVFPNQGPCMRCVFPDPPAPGTLPTTLTEGILGPVPVVIGSIASVTAMKMLSGKADPKKVTLTICDPWTNDFDRIPAKRNMNCRCCVRNRYDFLNGKA